MSKTAKNNNYKIMQAPKRTMTGRQVSVENANVMDTNAGETMESPHSLKTVKCAKPKSTTQKSLPPDPPQTPPPPPKKINQKKTHTQKNSLLH